VLLCEDVVEQRVLFGNQLTSEQESNLRRLDPSARPHKQKLCKMSEDKDKGAKAKVKRLLSAGVIREVAYLE
jgi:hypothetical protein